MNPSAEAVAAIRQHVADWTPTDADIAAALNAPAIDNDPGTRPTVAKPISVSSLMGMVSSASRARIYDRPGVVAFRDDMTRGDRAAVANWFVMAHDAGDLSDAEYAALMAELQATQPDPAWPAKVSWAQVHIGRPVDAQDIAASRPGA